MELTFYAKQLLFMISMPLWWGTMMTGDSDTPILKWVTVDKMLSQKIHSA